MRNKSFRVGPVAVPSSAGNLVNPPTIAGGVGGFSSAPNASYIVISHMSVVNKTAGPVTLSLYIGPTAGTIAGTEFAYNATSIPANSRVDWFGNARMDIADFLVGVAGAATSLAITVEGEIGMT